MKTTMKNLAAGTFIAFLLIVGNVKAEGTETKATTQAVETALQLENWMMDEEVWNKKPTTYYEIHQEAEPILLLEDWMTNAKAWNLNHNFVEVTETETEMELENWMTNEKLWNR
jgi:hypothetical protein